MWPDTTGLPSPTMIERTVDHSPSQPISAAPLIALAALGARGDAARGLVDRDDLLRGGERDQVRFLAGVVDHVEHVGAVHHGVGRVVLLVEAVIDRQLDEGLAGDRVPQLQALREHRPLVHLLGQAEHLEHAEHVGAELDAGADLLELGRLFDAPATGMPLRDSASAVPRPPMPPPTTRTGGRFPLSLIRFVTPARELWGFNTPARVHSRSAARARSSEWVSP